MKPFKLLGATKRQNLETCIFAGKEITINWTRVENLLEKYKNLNCHGWVCSSNNSVDRISIRDHRHEIIGVLAFIDRCIGPVTDKSENRTQCTSHYLRQTVEKWLHHKTRSTEAHVSNGIIILCMMYMQYDYSAWSNDLLDLLYDCNYSYFTFELLPEKEEKTKAKKFKHLYPRVGGTSKKIDNKEKEPSFQAQSLVWTKLFPLGECRQYVENKKSGVYEIYRKSEYGEYCVLYVGSSNNVRSRLYQHADLKGGNKELTTAIVKREIENFYARWAPTVDVEKVYRGVEEALIKQHGFGEGGLYIYNKTESTNMGKKRTLEIEEDEASNFGEASSAAQMKPIKRIRAEKNSSKTQEQNQPQTYITPEAMQKLCNNWMRYSYY